MIGRLLPLALNLAVLGVSTLATWLFVELVLFPAAIHRLPLALHERIANSAVRTLAQSSKDGPRPRDYVALVGDSYAAGEGDWRLTVDAGGNPPHSAAHLVHARTSRDVVSFGHAGAGHLRGLVTEPITRLAFLRRTLRFRTEDPADLVVLFYEGNDLEDNLEDLVRRYDERFEPTRAPDALPDPIRFERFIDEVVLDEAELAQQTRAFRFRHNFFVLRSALWNLGRWREQGALPRAGPRSLAVTPAAQASPDASAALLVNGERLVAPILLQAPAPELSEAQTETGLFVFARSLERLRERFGASQVRILYVPAPMSCYVFPDPSVSVEIDLAGERDAGHYPVPVLDSRSDSLCERVAAIAARDDLPFHDARPGLRSAARRTLIHGPRDWKHLNREGYEALADEIIALLDQRAPGAGCATGRVSR